MYADVVYLGTCFLLVLLVLDIVLYYRIFYRHYNVEPLLYGCIYSTILGAIFMLLNQDTDLWTILVVIGICLTYVTGFVSFIKSFHVAPGEEKYESTKCLMQCSILCAVCTMAMLWLFQLINIKALVGEW